MPAAVDAAQTDMRKLHVKKNDEVVVIAGANKGKRGRVIVTQPKSQRVIVEGVRMIKRHMRKSQQYPQGQIVEREGSIHISNVMKAAEWDARAAKHGATAPAQA
jgi:large subunit ribosomal protein L24